MNNNTTLEDGKDNIIANDPGASKYGNFINYYSFHSPRERINNLSSKMFQDLNTETFVCLDIGCNIGELTKSLKSYLTTLYPDSRIKILAIDIDETLIERAQEMNCDDIEFVAVDVMNEGGKDTIKQFLNKNNRTHFDIIFCFSVTMWIHLNHGDDGLLRFLHDLKSMTQLIIIETQPWKCYRSAQRRMKRSGKNFELYNSLKIRADVDIVIEKTICRNNYTKIYESALSSWNRKIQSFYFKNMNKCIL